MDECPTTDVMAPSGTFPKAAACAEEGEAIANANAYDGHEDLLVIDNEGTLETVCQIRFTVKRVGTAPPGCRYTKEGATTETDCVWTQTVEYSNPMMMVDVNGACANSGYGLNSEKIEKFNGCRAAIGYAPECLDHEGACRMKYYAPMGKWDIAPGGLSYCTAADAAAGMCSPADRFSYNPRANCTYR
jgi:hypothetical protein